MVRNQRDQKDLQSKLEGSTGGDHNAPLTSSKLWPGLKNPRIVRVSRAFGGKDRHSKVSTVRGLRDRRVRLSVPTAIQLYDLQARLGLNQPSKVVDWLLNAAQPEIDKLPPLQLPPEGFPQFSHSHEPPPPQASSQSLTTKSFRYMNEHGPRLMSSSSDKANGEEDLTTSFSQSTHWNADALQRSEPREDTKELLREKENTIKGINGLVSAQDLSHEILQRPNHSTVSGFLANAMPYASYFQWEPANMYLSQLGMRSSQSEAPVMSIPSSRSLAVESQIVFCPPGIMPSMFPSNVATGPVDFNAKQFGHLQMASSISQTPQSTLEINSLHLSSPSARPFQ